MTERRPPHPTANDKASADSSKKNSGSRYVESLPDIERCLKHIRDQRTKLTIRIDGSDESYECRILDITDKSILLEDISVHSAIKTIARAKNFSLSARDESSFVFIDTTRVTKVDEERGVPYLHVKMPKRLMLQQRRRASRFAIPMRIAAKGAKMTLMGGAEGHPYNGDLVASIIDISAGGCRIQFDRRNSFEPQQDMVFRSCEITIPPLLTVRSEAVIRHHHVHKPSSSLVCGVELINMQVTDRRRLEKFIQSIKNSQHITSRFATR